LGCLTPFEQQTNTAACLGSITKTYISLSQKTHLISIEIIPDLPEISIYCVPGFYTFHFDPSNSLLCSTWLSIMWNSALVYIHKEA